MILFLLMIFLRFDFAGLPQEPHPKLEWFSLLPLKENGLKGPGLLTFAHYVGCGVWVFLSGHWRLLWSASAERGTGVPRGDDALTQVGQRGTG